MVHVKAITFNGDSNIGMYGFANDKFAIVGISVDEEDAKQLGEILQVPVYRLNVLGTSLTGVFLAGNNENLFVSNVLFDYEKEALDKICKKHKTNLQLIDTIHTALGNNIVVGEKTILISSEFDESDIIQFKESGLDVAQKDIADTTVTGSSLVITSKGGVIHPLIEQEQGEEIEKILDIKLHQGSVNGGSPYVRSGILANKFGFVIGNISTGPEITNADEAFGFIGGDE